MEIGVLALREVFGEHIQAISKSGCNTVEIQKPEELDGVQGLIVFGEKSEIDDELMLEKSLLSKIAARAKEGMPVCGLGFGITLLAKEVENSNFQTLGLMDIAVAKLSSGQQNEKGYVDLFIPALGSKPIEAVLVGDLHIMRVKPNVGILSVYEDKIVMARQGDFLACSFYPRLKDDYRLYEYFVKIVKNHLCFHQEKILYNT